jgi:medium-chain acyl-[acyl-carrier-protein] hydrolase
MTLDKWVPFRNEGAGVCCRVFCFPHAAGSAASYRSLRHSMPPEFDFCAVELPGRAARLDEPPLTSMSALMERLSHVLQPLMGVSFGFFGHSVGAWTAYEAARQLRSHDGRSAVHLFVSSRQSPHRVPVNPGPARPRSDRELLAMLGRFGGTPTAVMQRPELIAALLPALRADLTLAEGYAGEPGSLACPITAFGGAAEFPGAAPLQSWRDFTRGRFRTHIFPGGHFYFSPDAKALAEEIIEDLRASGGLHAAGASSWP